MTPEDAVEEFDACLRHGLELVAATCERNHNLAVALGLMPIMTNPLVGVGLAGGLATVLDRLAELEGCEVSDLLADLHRLAETRDEP